MTSTSGEKQYRLTFEQREGYLYAYVEGEQDNYQISRGYWLEVAAEVVRTKAKRVLIDENIVESATLGEVFRLASEIPKMGFGPTRVAFVDRYLDQNDINAFAELVAVNRGLNGKIFNDESMALAWLLKDHQ
jgi:hypothetical protein